MVGSRRHNVGLTSLETLTDILVHGQDIAIPLRRELEMPTDATAARRNEGMDTTRYRKARVSTTVPIRGSGSPPATCPGPSATAPRSRARSLRSCCCSPAGPQLARLSGDGAESLRSNCCPPEGPLGPAAQQAGSGVPGLDRWYCPHCGVLRQPAPVAARRVSDAGAVRRRRGSRVGRSPEGRPGPAARSRCWTATWCRRRPGGCEVGTTELAAIDKPIAVIAWSVTNVSRSFGLPPKPWRTKGSLTVRFARCRHNACWRYEQRGCSTASVSPTAV